MDLVEVGGLMRPHKYIVLGLQAFDGAIRIVCYEDSSGAYSGTSKVYLEVYKIIEIAQYRDLPGPGRVLDRVVIIMDQLFTRHWTDHPD